MGNNNPQVELLRKIEAILTATDGTTNAESMNPMYFAFCSPGIPLPNSSLNFDINSKDGIQNLAQWSRLVNTIPETKSKAPISSSYTSGIWRATGSNLENIYQDFLSGAESSDTPLSEKDKKMYNKAYKYLITTTTSKDPFTEETKTSTGDSSEYQAYKNYKTKYLNALGAYNQARLSSITSADPKDKQNFSINAKILKSDIQTAYDDWVSLGNKAYVEEALDILRNLSGESFTSLVTEAKTDFDVNVLTDPIFGDFHPTPPIPIQLNEDIDGLTWSKYSFHHSEQEKYSKNSSGYIGGEVGGIFSTFSGFGFNVGASADISSDSNIVNVESDNWKVSFDLVQLPLSRGWFRYDLLSSHKWFWNKNAPSHDKLISAGHFPLNSSEDAMMPIYPTSILLARNVEIQVDTSSLKSAINKYSANVDVCVGWGPFNLGSIKKHTDASSKYNYVNIEQNSLKSTGISIIGFICEVIQDKLPQN
ncbi:hypothetical protein [Bacillus cereus group sp. MYBK217-2]|uniref:hypothetical protein n=1 Tax=Bacillus cereus group sp. MYBK217-2 TaxID=3450661 RepID=UPI003F7A2AF7